MNVNTTISASSLSGFEVVNLKGENLGEIKDLVVDLPTARVEYAILSFGGVLGLGDKLFAVPLGALAADVPEKKFVLDADEERLKSAPGFDKKDPPDFASPRFRERHYSFWEITGATR